MHIRTYQDTDLKMILDLFYNTVKTINSNDYNAIQIQAWLSGVEEEAWHQSLAQHHSYVAIDNNQIVGFGDIDDAGYVDRLYVHKEYQGRGIASALLYKLEHSVHTLTITTHASITAKEFFLSKGYQVIKFQQVERQGVLLTNYIMQKELLSK